MFVLARIGREREGGEGGRGGGGRAWLDVICFSSFFFLFTFTFHREINYFAASSSFSIYCFVTDANTNTATNTFFLFYLLFLTFHETNYHTLSSSSRFLIMYLMIVLNINASVNSR